MVGASHSGVALRHVRQDHGAEAEHDWGPGECAHCGSEKITQETDVLDTWFSSGLLPVSVFGWPNIDEENRADFDAFYPTSLLVTGFDILFFWVARMIMLGCWFAGDVPMPDGSDRPLAESVPFREVYIHALVRDANREKMSKTKGNVIDPIEIVKQYGTDAVRFTLASMASPGTDIAFNIARTEGYRAFANKIWNAARFIFMNVDRAAEIGIAVDSSVLGAMPTAPADAPPEARWIVAEFHNAAFHVNGSLEGYRFDDAANRIYQFFWGSFCDWYLEIVKLRLDFSENSNRNETNSALTTLISVFEASLRMLSPFMPFITEEIWQTLYDGRPPTESIALAIYPQARGLQLGPASGEMGLIQELVIAVRAKRKEIGVPERESIPILIHAVPLTQAPTAFSENLEMIQKLAHVSTVHFSDSHIEGADAFRQSHFGYFSGRVLYERTIDVAAERERLTKDIAKLEKQNASDEQKLSDPAFTAKAPANIVEGKRKQLAENRLLLEKAKAALAALPGN